MTDAHGIVSIYGYYIYFWYPAILLFLTVMLLLVGAPETANSNHTYYLIIHSRLNFMSTYEIRVGKDSWILFL